MLKINGQRSCSYLWHKVVVPQACLSLSSTRDPWGSQASAAGFQVHALDVAHASNGGVGVCVGMSSSRPCFKHHRSCWCGVARA